ncbi:kinase-like domain-containing protein [Favolaschia claudopus]|uniref:Kinase-like domain-containing protein n=1 Tax=Favolaschia claudopus TaxID=2862362 RepID=A0AAW0AL98_9AGAR
MSALEPLPERIRDSAHDQLVAALLNIQNSQAITEDALQSRSRDIQSIKSLMQQMMTGLGSANTNFPSWRDLQNLQFENLDSSNFTLIGQYPSSMSNAVETYEGIYLGRDKVAIKVVRSVAANEASFCRLKRECNVWKRLWDIDRGKHLLPYFGFWQTDEAFPHLVSPWPANGNALAYVKQMGNKADYAGLVKGVAVGVGIVHGIGVAHGDIKASNVAIDMWGNPLISDFGLFRIVEDITGVPFTESRGASDSYRWFAPEVCADQGVLSLSSDVYAYGMTVLELFTHARPYSDIKHTLEVVIRAARGEQPLRPMDNNVLTRGLDDELWGLLTRCWAIIPEERPTIQSVLDIFGALYSPTQNRG